MNKKERNPNQESVRKCSRFKKSRKLCIQRRLKGRYMTGATAPKLESA